VAGRHAHVGRISDRLLTLALVLLALGVGAFVSSIVYRWTGPSPPGAPDRTGNASGPRDPGADRGRIRVEVLNATGVPGLAGRMTRLLRGRGFDVVNYGNAAGTRRGPTAILDRAGDSRLAREVALALPGTPIREELAPDRFIDVTVIVGDDYERFFDPPAEGVPSGDGPLRDAIDRLREIFRS
jgi:hypothetical protein